MLHRLIAIASGEIFQIGKMRQLQKRKECRKAGVDQVSGKSI